MMRTSGTAARKYATDPIADIAGAELEISRKWRKPGASEFVTGTMQAAR
jgi:hypothetical protein